MTIKDARGLLLFFTQMDSCIDNRNEDKRPAGNIQKYGKKLGNKDVDDFCRFVMRGHGNQRIQSLLSERLDNMFIIFVRKQKNGKPKKHKYRKPARFPYRQSDPNHHSDKISQCNIVMREKKIDRDEDILLEVWSDCRHDNFILPVWIS